MNVKVLAREAREAAYGLRNFTAQDRAGVLRALGQKLAEEKQAIIDVNQQDIIKAKDEELPQQLIDRLSLDTAKIQGLIEGLNQLAGQEDLLGKVQLARELDEGLNLYRVACPIGVIGIVFEARPDALIQIAGLCLRTGNALILKGGSEARLTNRFLTKLVQDVLEEEGFPRTAVQGIESREDLQLILDLHEYIDLLIPRGSNAFVKFCMENTMIPVLGHADGVCHIYLHAAANLAQALPIILDAKTQATAVCNATETLLIDRAWSTDDIAKIIISLKQAGITLYGDPWFSQNFDLPLVHEWHHEYLDMTLSLKLVDGVDEAIAHINRYGSGHTDAILTEDEEVAETFMRQVDSANVFHNCSTRFADGFRFGFGAEVGISTSKIHARGPVGPEGLLSYQYHLKGSGQIVRPYVSGERQFTHRDLSSAELKPE